MPDPNQPINPTQTTDPTTPGMPVVEEITIPTMSQGQQSAPPPPPSDVLGDGGTPPPPDLPPVVPPVITPPPAKKFGGRRVIATILGLLVLGGGLTAGLILVRQQQIFREKAKEFCGECTSDAECGAGSTCDPNGCCVAPPPPPPSDACGGRCGPNQYCSESTGVCLENPSTPGPPPAPNCGAQTCTGDTSCQFCPGVGQTCVNNFTGECPPPPPPSSPLPGGYCRLDRECDTSIGEKCVSHQCTIPTPPPPQISCEQQCDMVFFSGSDQDKCKTGCKPPPGISCEEQCMIEFQFTHDQDKCKTGCKPPPPPPVGGGGCPAGYTTKDEIYTEATTCEETYPNQDVIQIGVNNHYGGICCLRSAAATPVPGISTKSGGGTPIPGTPPPGELSAQCLNIRAFDTNWNQLTATQLAALKAGDKVRFTVAGATLSGTFDKARFTINGVLRPEVTATRPGTTEFYDEYTIPVGTSSFSINAQLHHSTLGWF